VREGIEIPAPPAKALRVPVLRVQIESWRKVLADAHVPARNDCEEAVREAGRALHALAVLLERHGREVR